MEYITTMNGLVYDNVSKYLEYCSKLILMLEMDIMRVILIKKLPNNVFIGKMGDCSFIESAKEEAQEKEKTDNVLIMRTIYH